MLEIGCGSGRWVRGLFDSGSKISQYLGLDVSSTMAADAARAVAELPNARVVRGDARREGVLEEASRGPKRSLNGGEACKSFLPAPDRLLPLALEL